ncbi:hypothetical protein ACIQVO_38680 [Streptomyces sp. NPDC101062]|uniref:hypothetical protein n=1 Tax=unclassified Streptomyces TaxID=2593676 RepID=UPI0037FD7D63
MGTIIQNTSPITLAGNVQLTPVYERFFERFAVLLSENGRVVGIHGLMGGDGYRTAEEAVTDIQAFLSKHKIPAISGDQETQLSVGLLAAENGFAYRDVATLRTATRALAAWGITAHIEEDARESWLVIVRDQSTGTPPGPFEPHAVVRLHEGGQARVMVTDATGAERHLTTRPLEQLAECAADIAEWVSDPNPTAGSVLLAALAEHGVAAHTDRVGMSYAIPLDPATPTADVYNHAHLRVTDRSPSIEHDPAVHTGWTVWHHDENGEPAWNPLYIARDGEPVDCWAESAIAAAVITDWLAANRN